jgi:hypothetical protein
MLREKWAMFHESNLFCLWLHLCSELHMSFTKAAQTVFTLICLWHFLSNNHGAITNLDQSALLMQEAAISLKMPSLWWVISTFCPSQHKLLVIYWTQTAYTYAPLLFPLSRTPLSITFFVHCELHSIILTWNFRSCLKSFTTLFLPHRN